MDKSVVLRYIFNLACFTTAFGMTFWWLYRYSLDEDIVQMNLKPIDFQDGQYPMLSYCLADPFIESKLKKYDEALTAEKYKDILLGLISYKGMKNIDYDDVTLNFTKFYLGDVIRLRNGSFVENEVPNFLQELPQATYSGFSDGIFYKCIKLKSRLTNIDYHYFKFNSSLYPNGIRPSLLESTSVALHLPNQVSWAWDSIKYSWPKRIEKIAHAMDFKLQQIDILKRRTNKKNDPCTPDGLNFDQMILDYYLNKVGCKAPYYKTNESLKLCDSKKKMKESTFELMRNDKPMKPCTSALTLAFAYNEFDLNCKVCDWFTISITYPNQYREIKMIQAIDIHTVIGHSGGYIGLFLGKRI